MAPKVAMAAKPASDAATEIMGWNHPIAAAPLAGVGTLMTRFISDVGRDIFGAKTYGDLSPRQKAAFNMASVPSLIAQFGTFMGMATLTSTGSTEQLVGMGLFGLSTFAAVVGPSVAVALAGENAPPADPGSAS